MLPSDFMDLPPDVVFSIFACCDIYAVISTGQTCRYLHRLAFEKSVWLVLLDDLRRRFILDQNRTPNLKELSTDDLIKVVKRLVIGPETWSPQNLGSMSEISRQITLHPTIRTGPGILDWENEAKLLSSGRHVLFNNWHILECWNVADDKLVWKYTSAVEHASVLQFAAEETGQGDSLIVLVCIRTYPDADDRKNYLEIVDVDLQNGTQNILLTARAPDSDYDNPFCAPVICGTFAAVATNWRQDRYMFVNWTTQSYFILKCNPKSVSLLAIIPQHIVLKDPSIDVEVEVEEGQDKIHLISTDALAHWAPTFGIDAYGEFCLVSLDDMPRRSTFVSTDRWRSLGSFSVVESPLQDGTYRVWINGDMDNEGQGHLVGYRLSIPVGGVPQWRRRETKSEPGWRESLNCAVPYSGHMLSHSHSVHKIIPPTASFCSDHAEVQFPHAGDYIDVAQYAGALTYSTSSSVVIQYYK